MTVATALAVSWKPFTNSKPRAMSRARPSRMKAVLAMLVSPTELMSRLTLNATNRRPAARTAKKAMAPAGWAFLWSCGPELR